MKYISLITLFVVLCGCESHQHTITYEDQKKAEDYADSIRQFRQLAQYSSENKKMNAVAEILSSKKKTTETFGDYWELTIVNNSERIISDIQIISLPSNTVRYSGDGSSYKVNLEPGKTVTIKHPFTKESIEGSQNMSLFPFITKVRFNDGDFVERKKNINMPF
jgi:hypothetical protein